MNLCLDATGKVLMYGNGGPEPPPGGRNVTLTPEQEAAFLALHSMPHDGIVFDGEGFSLRPPDPSIPLPGVPGNVVAATPAQFRLELAARGKLDAATALVAAASPEVQIAFEYATEFRSDSPTLLALAAQIGMSEQDVKDALTAAAARNIGAL